MNKQDTGILLFTGLMWVLMLPLMLVAALVGLLTGAGQRMIEAGDTAAESRLPGYGAAKTKAARAGRDMFAITVGVVVLIGVIVILASLSLWGAQFGHGTS